jgi:glycerol-3-phosphate O-acyltransferase/dihydroxyacetone phosphate acyltransferase
MLTTFIVDTFMWILVNVYFREVAVVGLENVPKTGPVVFYGNHQNQFIDAMMIRAHCGRPVRFIIAEKSMHRPVIGQFARLMEAVPVVRPQDVGLSQAQGKIVAVTGNVITGEGTMFTKTLANGDVISWNVPSRKERCSAQVAVIVSDTTLQLTLPIAENDVPLYGTQYLYSRRIDHSEMYAEVYDTLAKNHCIGIFPEGGSHDRTSLQPLKAGVALFSLGATERNIHPQIVPCGLTYFFGHKFRSRAHIEFGEPINPPKELVSMFQSNKRAATGQLLEMLNANLRNVTINVSDWDTLKLLHSLRRLYQPPNLLLQTRDYLRLTRRLSVLIEERSDDPEFADFRNKVQSYNDFCAALLVRDSQAATLEKLDEVKATYTLLFRRLVMLVTMWIVVLPFCIIAAPVGIITHVLAEQHAVASKASSTVKVVAADVKGSYKIITGFIVAPLECLLLGLIVWAYSDSRTALTVFFSLPMAMYVSLLIMREALLELRAALPLVISLFSKHKQFRKLFDRRQKLVAHAKDIVSKFDPTLEKELAEYASLYSGTSREPSLFSLRHNQRRAADKMK